MCKKVRHKKGGFTLIEMSIVLVVIGLLVGGVLVGKDLIEAGEKRAIVTDIQRHTIAYRMFYDKFRAKPGDYDRAEQIWPGQTTNGNGDRKISPWNTEGTRAWQHMSLAGLYDTEYTGLNYSGAQVAGLTVPEGQLQNSGFNMRYATLYQRYTNYLTYGSGVNGDGSVNGGHYGPLMTPLYAQSIDEKMDDGLASYGKLFIYRGSGLANPACVNGFPTNPKTAVYIQLSDTTKSCVLRYRLD